MVAPLDPLRGPASASPVGAPRSVPETGDAFQLEFQRLLRSAGAGVPSAPKPPTASPLLADDLTASLDGVSESLRRATAHINSARAYFKGAPTSPIPDSGLDTRG